MSESYNLQVLPKFQQHDATKPVVPTEPPRWSGKQSPPELGTRLSFGMNGYKITGIASAYFIEHGFLGVQVQCDKVPGWWNEDQIERDKKKWGGKRVIHIFGIDLN